ncbi:MAG: ribbon-helix-helix protein, CopG family [Promethearchaeota archaeon]
MAIIQVRVDDEESQELEELAKKLGISKSELVRQLITRGKKGLLFDFAFARLMKNEISLCRAAVEAQLPITDFVKLAAERGYVYFKYDADELKRDVRSLKGLLEE